MADKFWNIVKSWAAANGTNILETQLSKLARHKSMVLETNKYMNLTAITDPEEFAVKHIIDSLSLLPYIPKGVTLADVGTGAGFPGLVLAIMREDLQVVLLDSLRKRIFFLQDVIEELNLANITAIHARAGQWDDPNVPRFDICVARAVAQMDKLAKWVLPLTASGGRFIAMKGPDVSEEMEKASPTIAKFGGLVENVDEIEISPGVGRSIVVIRRGS